MWRQAHFLTSLSSEASSRRLPGLIMKSLVISALGCGAGSSGAYVSLRMARRTVLRFCDFYKKTLKPSKSLNVTSNRCVVLAHSRHQHSRQHTSSVHNQLHTVCRCRLAQAGGWHSRVMTCSTTRGGNKEGNNVTTLTSAARATDVRLCSLFKHQPAQLSTSVYSAQILEKKRPNKNSLQKRKDRHWHQASWLVVLASASVAASSPSLVGRPATHAVRS